VKHQGWLTVEPGPVRGSRFSLFLPAVSTPVRRELPGVVANFRGAGTALVVDDEEALRDSVGGFLTSMGFSVLLAANERQALDRCAGVWAQGRSVALGVLDLTTKDGPGGIEICRKLRQSGHPMVLIAMSGYSEELAGGSPGQAGFDGYLTKPFSLQELAQVLSGYFENGGSRLAPGEAPL
jgi:two-component system response regulator PrrA